MRSIMPVLVVLACLCGCSHVHDVNPTAGDDSLEELNQTVKGKRVTIEFRDGHTLTGDGVHVRADTTFWYESQAVTDRSAAPTSDLARISFREPFGQAGRYAKHGLIWGGVAGSVAGLWVAGRYEYLLASGVLVGGGLGAALGGGAALVIAFIVAPERAFVFLEADASHEGAGPPDGR